MDIHRKACEKNVRKNVRKYRKILTEKDWFMSVFKGCEKFKKHPLSNAVQAWDLNDVRM